MNLAILIGVSNYAHSVSNLPACRYDAELMERMLSAIGGFDEVLSIYEHTNTKDVKDRVADFISSKKGTAVDRCLFYYSGHGLFDGMDFRYPLSDYQTSKLNQTSLSNNEVDVWLRTLSANITIKIIDACESGISYVKDPATLESYLKGTQPEFKKCYFMFSSHCDQKSWQDSQLSEFTRSIIDAVIANAGRTIRVRDIADFAADQFLTNSSQRPFFVSQADNTEIFAHVPSDIEQRLHGQPVAQPAVGATKAEESRPSLVELVKADAERYASDAEALAVIQEFIPRCIQEFRPSGDTDTVYSIAVEYTQNYWGIPNIADLAKWFYSNGDNYFVNVQTTTEYYEVEVEKLSPFSIGFETKTVKRKRVVPCSFESTQMLSYHVISITAAPKFPNINWSHCAILPILSKTHVGLFYFYTNYKETNWKEKQLRHDFVWRSIAVSLKDHGGISEAIRRILSEFETYFMKPIRDRFQTG